MKALPLIAMSVGLTVAGCMSMAQKGAMNLGYKAMDHHNYEDALRKFSQAEKYREATPAMEAEIMFQRGRCYEALGHRGDALGVYRFLVQKHADTSWAFQAKERLAELESAKPSEPVAASPST